MPAERSANNKLAPAGTPWRTLHPLLVRCATTSKALTLAAATELSVRESSGPLWWGLLRLQGLISGQRRRISDFSLLVYESSISRRATCTELEKSQGESSSLSSCSAP